MSDFIIDDSELYETLFSETCSTCKHLISGLDRKCKAFNKIPDEIWKGIKNHTEPYPGDNGIQYESIEE